jgi:hypothetical protein
VHKGHWLKLVEGTRVYLTQDDPPLVAALYRVGPNLWHLSKVSGPQNAFIRSEPRRDLTNKLTAAGIALVASEPGHALSILQSNIRLRRAGPPLPELADLDDNLFA